MRRSSSLLCGGLSRARAEVARPALRCLATGAIETAAIRNVAIIAHVDHGKTTLVDKLLQLDDDKSSEDSADVDRAMDSMALERERGITIRSKVRCCSWWWWRWWWWSCSWWWWWWWWWWCCSRCSR